MRSICPRCAAAISSVLVLCIISLPLRAQERQTVTTESDLIVALVKAKKVPEEITTLLQGHASLVTDNLWETLMALAAQKFYQNSEEAFRLYDLACEVALQLKDQKRLAKTYYNIARSHSGLGDYDKATAAYLESQKAFEAAGSERDVIYILSDLGIISLLRERYDEARQYSEASISLAEKLMNSTAPAGAWPDAFGISGSLRTLAELSLRDGDIDQAISQYQRSLNLLNELNHDRSYDFYVTETHAGLGRVYTSAGDHVKALASLNSARKTATAGQIPNVLNSLGYLYLEQEDYAQADAQFHQSLKIYRSTKNQIDESAVLLNLGVVQQRQGNYIEALVLFRQSLDAAVATKFVDVQIAALEGIGVVSTAQSHFDDALKALGKALELHAKHRTKCVKRNCYGAQHRRISGCGITDELSSSLRMLSPLLVRCTYRSLRSWQRQHSAMYMQRITKQNRQLRR
jgi:tetratricopeptide (TPR) repeat protein